MSLFPKKVEYPFKGAKRLDPRVVPPLDLTSPRVRYCARYYAVLVSSFRENRGSHSFKFIF